MTNRLTQKSQNRSLRRNRVRSKVSGSSDRPRLSVNISLRHVTAQVIDDSIGKTLAYATTIGNKSVSGTLTDRADMIGLEIARQAKSKKITRVVLDRGSKLYHGRVTALANAARKEGLEF